MLTTFPTYWLRFLPLAIFLLFLNNNRSTAAVFDWKGGNILSGTAAWSDPLNWNIGSAAAGRAPGSTDDVRIGVVAYATLLNAQPIVTASATCASLTFGNNNTPVLTVNSNVVLTVSGSILVNHNTTNTTSNYNTVTTITGGGSIDVQDFQIGTTSQLPNTNLANGASTSYLSSQINQLNIWGNLLLISTVNTRGAYTYPKFQIDANTVKIHGQLIATHNGTAGTLYTGDPFRSKLAVGDPTTGSTSTNISYLYIYNNTFLPSTLSAEGVDFVGAGTNTVIYASTSGNQIVYPAASYIGSVPYNYFNISFEGAATKTFNAGTVTIGGNWSSTGGKVDLTTDNITLNFDGTAQTLTDAGSDGGNGVVFKTVNFLTSGVKTLQSGNFSVSTDGLLTLGTSGTTQLAAGGHLTLLSNATGSASINVMPANCSITGNVNVQRYLVGGTTKSGTVYTARGYRLLSSPVNISASTAGSGNIDLNYLKNSGVLVSGPSGATGFNYVNATPTLYLYRENVAVSNTTFTSGKHKGVIQIRANGNVDLSDGTTNVPLPVGNGYIMYYIGNSTNPTTKATASPTQGPESMAITATGTLNQNAVTINLWYTPGGATGTTTGKLSYTASLGTNSAGFNMVGNPYPCSIDLNSLISANAGITNNIYELDNTNPGQSYIVYNPTGTGSSPRAQRYAVSGQGLIVKATGINQVLTFTESMKAPQTTPSILLMGLPQHTEEVAGFYMKLEQDSLINDYCGIYFNSQWSDSFDDQDAADLDGASPRLYMSSYTTDNKRAAVNKLSDYTKGKTVKLYVSATTDALYQLKMEGMRGIDTLYDVWLRDKYMKDSLDIRRYGSYNFRIKRADTASYGANRFDLIIRRRPLAAYQLVSFKADRVPEGIKLTWKTNNEGTYTGFTVQRNTNGTTEYLPLTQLQSNGSGSYSYIDKDPQNGINVYRLAQNDINEQIGYSNNVIVDNTVLADNSNMSVYPNPAVQSITLSIKNTDQAVTATSYSAYIYSTSGQLMMRKTISSTVSTHDISPFKPGTYLIQLIKPTGEIIGQSKFIKN